MGIPVISFKKPIYRVRVFEFAFPLSTFVISSSSIPHTRFCVYQQSTTSSSGRFLNLPPSQPPQEHESSPQTPSGHVLDPIPSYNHINTNKHLNNAFFRPFSHRRGFGWP